MQPKRFLIAPLDWGLGHATRCIPIIRQLLQYNCEVIIAGNGKSLTLLKIEFPQLSVVELPAYDPQYAADKFMLLKIMCQLPKFTNTIRAEHYVIQKIVSDKNIDIIISDNRFGCWSAKTKNIFITHQVNILMPAGWQWLGWFVNRINQRYIKKFNACWVPDTEGENLTGVMSLSKAVKVKWIGMLSRFTYSARQNSEIKYDVLVILSGPEPQRMLLEELLVEQISETNITALIVRGIPGDSNRKIISRVEVVDFLNANELEKAILQSNLVVARSGYSTVMDMAALKRHVLFIPTPGQTEQAYLAKQMKVKRIAYFAGQNNLDLKEAIEKAKDYTGFINHGNNNNQLKKYSSGIASGMKEFIKAFQYALKGIAFAFESERNIKVHFIIATLTITGGLYFNITAIEWCAVILCIGLVLALELINTAIEDLVDLVTLEWKPLAGRIKDAAAGAVLIASIAALVIGIIIFRKYVM